MYQFSMILLSRRYLHAVAGLVFSLFVALPAHAVMQESSGLLMCSEEKVEGQTLDVKNDAILFDIAKAFESGDFKTLVDSAELWKKKDCLLDNGETRISYWLGGFSRYFDKNRDWEASSQKVEKFKKAYPGSALPLLVESRYWSDYGYAARGSGYASTVSEADQRLFRERLTRSEKVLLDARDDGSAWPMWYWQMIRVYALLGRSSEDINRIFLEGTKKFNNELAIYTEMSMYMEPRWGGSWDQVDHIALYASQSVRREPADATYTRMYWATASMMKSQEKFFSETKASWGRMKVGFISLLNIYPESSTIRNAFLKFSCLAEDKEAYLKYRHTVTQIDARVWRANLTSKHCDSMFGFVE